MKRLLLLFALVPLTLGQVFVADPPILSSPSAAEPPTDFVYDTMESYTDGESAADLNGGTRWSSTSYVEFSKEYFVAYGYDTMEGYTDSAAVTGLNGGTALYGYDDWHLNAYEE